MNEILKTNESKAYGVYDIKLIDEKTGKVVKHITKKNAISPTVFYQNNAVQLGDNNPSQFSNDITTARYSIIDNNYEGGVAQMTLFNASAFTKSATSPVGTYMPQNALFQTFIATDNTSPIPALNGQIPGNVIAFGGTDTSSSGDATLRKAQMYYSEQFAGPSAVRKAWQLLATNGVGTYGTLAMSGRNPHSTGGAESYITPLSNGKYLSAAFTNGNTGNFCMPDYSSNAGARPNGAPLQGTTGIVKKGQSAKYGATLWFLEAGDDTYNLWDGGASTGRGVNLVMLRIQDARAWDSNNPLQKNEVEGFFLRRRIAGTSCVTKRRNQLPNAVTPGVANGTNNLGNAVFSSCIIGNKFYYILRTALNTFALEYVDITNFATATPGATLTPVNAITTGGATPITSQNEMFLFNAGNNEIGVYYQQGTTTTRAIKYFNANTLLYTRDGISSTSPIAYVANSASGVTVTLPVEPKNLCQVANDTTMYFCGQAPVTWAEVDVVPNQTSVLFSSTTAQFMTDLGFGTSNVSPMLPESRIADNRGCLVCKSDNRTTGYNVPLSGCILDDGIVYTRGTAWRDVAGTVYLNSGDTWLYVVKFYPQASTVGSIVVLDEPFTKDNTQQLIITYTIYVTGGMV